jgi:predicted metal-binding membrane protein
MGDMAFTMGMRPTVFMVTWVVMMVAMMFPTAAPMILTFERVHSRRRERGASAVPTSIFVAGYMLVWSAFGLLALGAATWLDSATESGLLPAHALARLGGGTLVMAGLYQLSPLKYACLSKCRTPMQFVLHSWKDGRLGALHMGLEHGAYCLGCCWLLFVILIPLGLMNVSAMALITLLIFAEKSLPVGQRVAKGAALVLVAYGLVVFGSPAALPTMMQH